jgi:type VI secretion system protein ImpL
VLQGVGGTRNCDWFFTTEGILLDTAGRYAVQEEHRASGLAFWGCEKVPPPCADQRHHHRGEHCRAAGR